MPCLLALILLSPNPQPLATTNLLSFSIELDVCVCDYVCVCVCTPRCSVVSNCLGPHGLAPLSMGFSGKNNGVGCHTLLQGIFPTQGLNPHLLCRLIGREILYPWAPGNLYRAERHVLYKSAYAHHASSCEHRAWFCALLFYLQCSLQPSPNLFSFSSFRTQLKYNFLREVIPWPP